MYFYLLLSFQCFNPNRIKTDRPAELEPVPALDQQQPHPASCHREGGAKSESLVKIGIHRVIVCCWFFLQAVNHKNTLEYSYFFHEWVTPITPFISCLTTTVFQKRIL